MAVGPRRKLANSVLKLHSHLFEMQQLLDHHFPFFGPVEVIFRSGQKCRDRQEAAAQLSGPNRLSISSRSNVKSMGLVSNPVAPPSIAFRLSP